MKIAAPLKKSPPYSQQHPIKVEVLSSPPFLKIWLYYSCLNDGNTNSSVTEEEVIFVLFLKEGTPTIKYLSIEPVKIADTPGLVPSIEDAFEIIGSKSFTDKLVGINVDGAGVNVGKHRGVGKLIQEKATWLQVIHCFNHQV